MLQHWSIPPWITSRSYFTGTEKSRTILTNSRWATHLVLEDLSSDMWSKLSERFTLGSLKVPLAEIGIDIEDAEHLKEIENFLGSLRQEGCLVLEGAENFQPPQWTLAHQEQMKQMLSVAAKFNGGLETEGLLATAMMELTYRCNEKCVHCFNPRHNQPLDSSNDLTTAEVKALLHEMDELGVYSVTFTGGEASLRDDFFELLDEVKRLKLAVNIFTNGQMPEENIRRLADYYPATVGVSVYSANPEIHDATTRIKGSFEKSVKALKILHELGVRTQMKSPLMNHTVHGYKELLKLCDELGAIPQFDLTIIAATDGNQNVLKHQVCDTEVLSQVFRDPRLALYVGLDAAEKGRRTAPVDGTLCGAGCTSLSIAPDGSVYVCDSLPIVLGNVRDGGLKTVWENSKPLKQWRNITTQDTNECGLYQKCSYCNYCPGAALLAKNDIFDISESVCRIAEVRRDVAMNLEKGNDPLKEYLQKHGKPFGNDLTFHKPAEGDLPNVEINHSGENFVKRVNEIKRNGNAIRKTKHYEPDSPMDLYNHGELRKNQDSGHFLETGR